MPARVHGSEWVFAVRPGAATIYASDPDGKYLYMDTGAGLVDYSAKALRRKLAENPRSAGMLRTEKIAWGVNTGMVLGGAILIGVGFANSKETVDEYGEEDGGIQFSPLVPVGLGVMVGGWIPALIARPQFENALKAYNEDVPPR